MFPGTPCGCLPVAAGLDGLSVSTAFCVVTLASSDHACVMEA